MEGRFVMLRKSSCGLTVQALGEEKDLEDVDRELRCAPLRTAVLSPEEWSGNFLICSKMIVDDKDQKSFTMKIIGTLIPIL